MAKHTLSKLPDANLHVPPMPAAIDELTLKKWEAYVSNALTNMPMPKLTPGQAALAKATEHIKNQSAALSETKAAPVEDMPVEATEVTLPKTEKSPAAFLVLDLPRVLSMLKNTRAASYQYVLEADPKILSTFRARLKEELAEVIEDAVEVAFYRAYPDAFRSRRDGHQGDLLDDSDDGDHTYKSKNHCETCSEYWWEKHSLHVCIEANELDNCEHHVQHNGAECGWSEACSLHKYHKVHECNGNCYTKHSEYQWHVAILKGLIGPGQHDKLYPGCTVTKEQQSALVHDAMVQATPVNNPYNQLIELSKSMEFPELVLPESKEAA